MCIFKNRPCQDRSTRVNINWNEGLYYPFTVSVSKCDGSCNSIDDPYAKVCVPDKVKGMNVKKVFNLMLRVNDTIFLVHHESCKYKCGLKVYVRMNESVCNSKQKWNHDE